MLKIITIVLIGIHLSGCTFMYIGKTYGESYSPVDGAVYAESNKFNIRDRPDLNKMLVHPFLSESSKRLATRQPSLYKKEALNYLSLDRNCEITGQELLVNPFIEFTYSCKK